MLGMKLDFWKHEVSSQLNGIYIQVGLRGMLEGNVYRALNVFFSLFFANSDTWMGYENEAPSTKFHFQYT